MSVKLRFPAGNVLRTTNFRFVLYLCDMSIEQELDKRDLEAGIPSDTSEELYERLNLKVDKGQEPMRIDKFLVQRIENASRNKIQKALESGMVLVNNRQVQPNYKIRPQDEIIVYSDKEA